MAGELSLQVKFAYDPDGEVGFSKTLSAIVDQTSLDNVGPPRYIANVVTVDIAAPIQLTAPAPLLYMRGYILMRNLEDVGGDSIKISGEGDDNTWLVTLEPGDIALFRVGFFDDGFSGRAYTMYAQTFSFSADLEYIWLVA